MTVSLSTNPSLNERPRLHLLGGPYVVIGTRRIDIPEGSQRLLVFVALNGGRAERKRAAGVLWPAGNDSRASGNLRSALWRLKRANIRVLGADKCALTLNTDTYVDVSIVFAWARRIIERTARSEDLRTPEWRADALDLLPGWYDDWVIFERERLRQRMLYALEALSSQLTDAGRCAEAVEAAMTAIRVEPLRESAQRALIGAHLAAGNRIEANRVYALYREQLQRELSVEPSADLSLLMASRWAAAGPPPAVSSIGPALGLGHVRRSGPAQAPLMHAGTR
jgi:DNA-binding SARP family transcriptional activator